MNPPPDWKLPAGIDRNLWDYLHESAVARGYDAYLGDSPVAKVDIAFAAKHFPHPGRLIDLGCGTGRLLIALAEMGFSGVGVDQSEEMLRIVGEKARTANLAVACILANLVELNALADQSFDYAACLFSTLGMIRGAANRERAVRHVFRLLRPGGVFVLHVHNRWHNLWTRPGRRWLIADSVRAVFGRETGNWTMPAHQGLAGLTLHLFGRREILRLLRRVGFTVGEVQPLGFGPDGLLRWPGWFSGLRAHGYLVAARRPLD